MNAESHPAGLPLEPARFPLWGSRLVEASAGTGKTWTISALYVRLVLGHGGENGFHRPLTPAEILVMTFTRAATRELSERIRARLTAAARGFRGEAPPPGDDFLTTLIADYPEGPAREEAAWRLAMAAEGMDDGAVFTIDAWCQRMLREHAFDTGSLFDEELIADEGELLAAAVQDYWRQECYPLAPELLGRLMKTWPQVSVLCKEIEGLATRGALGDQGPGEGRTLAEVLGPAVREEAQGYAGLKAGWAERAEGMLEWLNRQLPAAANGWNGNKLQQRYFMPWLETLKTWALDPEARGAPSLATGWERLTPEGLRGMRRDPGAPFAVPPEFQALAELKDRLASLPSPDLAIRRHAIARIGQRLRLLKARAGTWGFADLLGRLHQALQGPRGESLRARILTQYPVALIDEFQDTSPVQYGIFDQVYRAAEHDPQTALLLIGDPKQSIYRFRGADIYSYLRAREATAGRHYQLAVNYRSTDGLVAVVNRWFARAEAQPGPGAFRFREPDGSNPLPFGPVAAQGRAERLVDGQGAVPPLTLVHDLELQSKETLLGVFAERCAEQIVAWLNDPRAGFETPGQGFQRLCPRDLAVLVRTGKEAAAVRRALQRRRVASVYLSDRDSVFQGDEARDLVDWLRAVANPQDPAGVRAALATRTLGLDLAELAWLAHDDEALDGRTDQLRTLRAVWQTQGVLAMLRQTLYALGLPGRWLTQPDGERRLTNYLHLAELLQAASNELDGEQALIRWLVQEIADGSAAGDEQVIRLESDADLVQVVTVHKSKGLEYPVVLLPYATSFREVTRQGTRYEFLPAGDGTRRLVLDLSEADLRLAEEERLREDLRACYVALTRARHALWLGFGAVRVGNARACQTHKSAAGCLVGGATERGAADWLAPLEELAAGTGMVLRPAVRTSACTPLDRPVAERPLLDLPPYRGDFDRAWTIASYSRMTRQLHAQRVPVSGLAQPRPSDDEWPAPPAPAGQGLDDPSPAPPAASPPGPVPIRHAFARGPVAGNFLHTQLEWLAADRAAPPDPGARDAELRQRCRQAGYGDQAEALAEWLREVIETPLPGLGVALGDLRVAQAELEFWLPLGGLATGELDRLCRAHLLPGVERPALQGQALHGMLLGFADLVFEHEGRYWVLDYKSNHLGGADGDYPVAALERAMAAHRYDVQAAIYLLALHRLLRARLGDAYCPARHLGGALYLFLRGVRGPARGLCLIPAGPAWLDALDALFAAGGAHP